MEKSLSKTNSGRRSFLWKAGAAMTAAAAAAVPGIAKNSAEKNTAADLARQLGMLEDEKAIRALHQKYEALLDSGDYAAVADLFEKDAAVVFNGGVYKGKSSVTRLYRDHFSAGLTGKKIGPAPGFDVAPETVTVAEDRMSAAAQFPYSIQVGAPLPDSQLVQMARLQGEGFAKWSENGVYEITYAKCGQDGSWKIARLEHRVISSTDYRPGKAYANPIAVSPFAQTYPADPTGPDSLIA